MSVFLFVCCSVICSVELGNKGIGLGHWCSVAMDGLSALRLVRSLIVARRVVVGFGIAVDVCLRL